MNESDKASKTPITDLLADIPEDYRFWIIDGRGSSHIPIGRLSREAIAEIQRLESELAAAKAAISSLLYASEYYGEYEYVGDGPTPWDKARELAATKGE